ncbi:hypothetical protein [Mariniflexile maritimum]|uniref:hypothetical protein n=1 Tax=Mariniflexile maritimum TaxID=2682493 RepID=UPI001E074951|nr:hypothetical protein [Mariniflexile maritimum]MCB0449637.1 hypothetical protein [Confluentibacter sp.]
MFNQRKNKSFNPPSVVSKEKMANSELDATKKSEFISKWRREHRTSTKVKGVMPLRTLLIVLVLLLICMYLLESKFN